VGRVELGRQRGRRQHKAGDDDFDLSSPVELVVLAVKERAARCRMLGADA